MLKRARLRALRRILSSVALPFTDDDPLCVLHTTLKRYISWLCKAKSSALKKYGPLSEQQELDWKRSKLHQARPQLVSDALKSKIVQLFDAETSSQALSTFVCAVCSESTSDFGRMSGHLEGSRAWVDPAYPQPPLSFTDSPLANPMIDPAGVTVDPDTSESVSRCRSRTSSLHKKKLP